MGTVDGEAGATRSMVLPGQEDVSQASFPCTPRPSLASSKSFSSLHRDVTSFLLIRRHYLTCHLCLHVPKLKDTQRASPPRHAVPREPALLPGTVCADPMRRAAWRERERPRLRGQMIDPWDAARSPTESGPAVLCQWLGARVW